MARSILLIAWLMIGSLASAADEVCDVTIGWPFPPGQRPTTANFYYNGRAIGTGREAFETILASVEKLPKGASIVWGPDYSRCGACSGREPRCLAKTLYPDLWEKLETISADGGFALSSDYPTPDPAKVPTSDDEDDDSVASSAFSVSFSNYRGPDTGHDEVLYFTNGKYIGRGDEAFDKILRMADRLEAGTKVVLPRFRYSGRWAVETFSAEKLQRLNDELSRIAPFANRIHELEEIVEERGLDITYSYKRPQKDAFTVHDWGTGDRYGTTFVRYGKIIRHYEDRGKPAAHLSWTGYQDGKRRDNGERPEREPENNATYLLNDVELGQGVDGFANVMDEIAKLPKGAVVQVQACLRTKPPFTCPIIFEGHRHFERSGFEPYFGMFPWLIEVVRSHELELQWLPDEDRSAQDCELNK